MAVSGNNSTDSNIVKPKQKQLTQGKSWCFTMNNYPEDLIEQIECDFDNSMKRYLFGKRGPLIYRVM